MQNKNTLTRMVGNTNSFFIFSCSKQHADLAKSELEIYYKTTAISLGQGLYLLELSTLPLVVNHFGYVHFASKVCFSGRETEAIAAAEHIQSPYKIELFASTKLFPSVKVFADYLHDVVSLPVVDLHTPAHTYIGIFCDTQFYFCELLATNTDMPHLRKAHHKKHLHPTSLDPRLAKAMITLSGARSFHDPFCGVGGIVIEGALLGLHATGSDIQQNLIRKAQENAVGFAAAAEFFVADATSLDCLSEAYISDLPYGKNSLLSENKEILFKKFFSHAATQTSRLVIGCDNVTPLISLATAAGWSCQKTFTLYVHKSLSRTIYVFAK